MRTALKKHAATLAVALCLVGGVVFSTRSAAPNADSVYYGGKIYTMTDVLNDSGTPDFSKLKGLSADKAKIAEVVAAKNGKIVFVGSEAEARAQGYFDAARKVDLQGHVMLPGLIDGHGHFPGQGTDDLYKVNANSAPLGPIHDIGELQEAIRAKCASTGSGENVIGYSYDDLRLGAHPTLEQLNAACPNKPVYVTHISGHMAVANGKALVLGGLASNVDGTPTPLADSLIGVKKTNGKLNGLLMETAAMQPVNTKVGVSNVDTQKTIARANQVYAAAGITTADEGITVVPNTLPQYQKALVNGNLTLRVAMHPAALYGGPALYGNVNREAMGWNTSSADTTNVKFLDGSSALRTGADMTRHTYTITVSPLPAAMKNTNIPLPAGLNGKENMLMQGAHKILFDGSPQGYSAWLKEPGYYYDYYNFGASSNNPDVPASSYFIGTGDLNCKIDEMTVLMDNYQKAGISTETHTNGSAAAEYWAAALEHAVAADNGAHVDTRHTSIHGQMMELQLIQRLTGNYAAAAKDIQTYGDDMYRNLQGAFKTGSFDAAQVGGDNGTLPGLMKAQNIFMSYYINHTYFWGKAHMEKIMGPGRARNMSPVGWSILYDQPYSFHNDTDITPIDQLRSIQSAVTRRALDEGVPPIHGTDGLKELGHMVEGDAVKDTVRMKFWDFDQRINALQAMLGVTYLPAWQNKLDDRIGSLQPGHYADLTILDLDPVQVASAAPLNLANIRVTSTIVGDHLVYGFLPGSLTFAAAPKVAYVQNAGVTVSGLTAASLSNEEADKIHALQKGETRYGTYDIDANVSTNGDVGVFQMELLGNNAPVKAFRLYSVANSNAPEAFAYAHDMTDGGNFWIAPLSDPLVPLAEDDVLSMNKAYVLFYTMKDGGKFDAARTRAGADGKITGSVALVTSGSLPTNRSSAGNSGGGDDSGGGCTIGATPSYDLLILLLALAGVAVLRSLRRRNMP